MSQLPISIMVPVFRAAAYVREALESILAQVTDDMEVLIFDDASDDGTLDVINAVVRQHGRGHVQVVRHAAQQRARNFSRMVEEASGEVLIWCHGDDVCMPGRFARIIECFRDPQIMLVSSAAYVLDTESRITGIYAGDYPDQEFASPAAFDGILYHDTMLGASLAWRKELATRFPIDSDLLVYGEDMILPIRATLIGKYRFLREPLIGWRRHDRNNHQVQGAGNPDDTVREPYLGLLQTVLMIRMKDLETAIAAQGETPELTRALETARKMMAAHLEEWLRVRGRLLASEQRPTWVSAAGSRAAPVQYRAIPAGIRLETGTGGMGTKLLLPNNGWFDPEPNGTWSRSTALLCFHLTHPAQAGAWLTLFLANPPWAVAQKLVVECRGEVLWSGALAANAVRFAIPERLMPAGEVSILLHIEPRAPACELPGGPAGDTRMLGVALLAFQVDLLTDFDRSICLMPQAEELNLSAPDRTQ